MRGRNDCATPRHAFEVMMHKITIGMLTQREANWVFAGCSARRMQWGPILMLFQQFIANGNKLFGLS